MVSFIICHRFWYVRYNSPYKQLFLKLKHAAGKSGEIFGSCKDVLECLLVRSRASTSFLLLFLLQVQGRDRPHTCSAVINQCSSEGDTEPYVGKRINRDFENRKFALESLGTRCFSIKSADRRTLWTLCPRMLWCAFIGARGDSPPPAASFRLSLRDRHRCYEEGSSDIVTHFFVSSQPAITISQREEEEEGRYSTTQQRKRHFGKEMQLLRHEY